MRLRKRPTLLGLTAAAALAVTLTGCASPAASTIDIGADTVVVDVRTPAEYAAGHLEGAINIDLQSAEFETEVAQLDPDADYVVYCKSGNRSAQAAGLMEAAGLDIEDAGGVSEASAATGLPLVP